MYKEFYFRCCRKYGGILITEICIHELPQRKITNSCNRKMKFCYMLQWERRNSKR